MGDGYVLFVENVVKECLIFWMALAGAGWPLVVLMAK